MTAPVQPDAADRPRVRDGLDQVELDGVRVIWDHRLRQVHRLNRTAAAILDGCDGVRSTAAIVDEVAGAFSTSPEDIERDVLDTIDELSRVSVLSPAPSDPPPAQAAAPRHQTPDGRASSKLARRLVEERPWRHRTATLAALAFDFAVVADEPWVAALLDEVLAGLPSSTSERPHLYSVREKRGAHRPWRLSLDGTLIHQDRAGGAAIGYLLWHLNQMAVDSMPRSVVLHAAAAAPEGQTVLLPGDPDSGKSTLVAGLCAGGAGYLTDEALALDPDTGLVWPYPKPVALQAGSWSALPDLEGLAVAVPDSKPVSWQVPAARLAGGVVTEPTRASAIVLPTYAPETATSVRPLSPVDTLTELLRHCFDFTRLGGRGLTALAELVRSTPGYAIDVGDLPSAQAAIANLLDGG